LASAKNSCSNPSPDGRIESTGCDERGTMALSSGARSWTPNSCKISEGTAVMGVGREQNEGPSYGGNAESDARDGDSARSRF
jgi:hypothetical protein